MKIKNVDDRQLTFRKKFFIFCLTRNRNQCFPSKKKCSPVLLCILIHLISPADWIALKTIENRFILLGFGSSLGWQFSVFFLKIELNPTNERMSLESRVPFDCVLVWCECVCVCKWMCPYNNGVRWLLCPVLFSVFDLLLRLSLILITPFIDYHDSLFSRLSKEKKNKWKYKKWTFEP